VITLVYHLPRARPQASVTESSVVLPPVKREPFMYAITSLSAPPECPKCSTRMMLARIVPEGEGKDVRTFESACVNTRKAWW
jgi:hypothetical protein